MATFKKIIALSIAVTVLWACSSQTNKQNSTTVNTTITQPRQLPQTTEKMCFFYALNRDTTTVSLTINGNDVVGEMVWNPWQKDGAIGTLKGTKTAANELQLIYNYIIEGSHQTETKTMKIANGKLLIKTGELIDPNNDRHLQYKNPLKSIYSKVLQKIVCPQTIFLR